MEQVAFGVEETLRVDRNHESLLSFDVSSIPPEAVIDSATLSLMVGDEGTQGPIAFHAITAGWVEASVDYQSFAQSFDRFPWATLQPNAPNTRKTVDLTDLVEGWNDGQLPNFGVLLETHGRVSMQFVSRDSPDTSAHPLLDVCYTLPDDHCDPDPCQNGGLCRNEVGGYSCECPPGYEGTNCEANIDDCASEPCQNGATCVDGVGSYTCECAPGYEGTHCETDTDECSPNPCQNGGVCTDGIDSYRCDCPPGYGGDDCEIDLDECAEQPCQNGTCVDEVAGYSCTCDAGYEGTHCEIDIDDCAAAPCLNGGTCVDGVDSYSCVCAPGYGGDDCEVDLDDCSPNPCQNGGLCIDGVASYSCLCRDGWGGTDCELGSCAGEAQKLVDGAGQAEDQFGRALEIDGDVMVVGIPGADSDETALIPGAVMVYRRGAGGWIEEQRLTASDGEVNDQFGYDVDVSGDVIVVGAQYDDDDGDGAGAAYVFRFDGSSWIEDQKILASNGKASRAFGRSVAIDGGRIVVGTIRYAIPGMTTGSVYVYEDDGVEFQETSMLLPQNGTHAAWFGRHVDLDGDLLIVGAPLDSGAGNRVGAAHVFRYDGVLWNEEAKLIASDWVLESRFGWHVAIDGDLAVVGAGLDPENGTQAGAAYAFRHDGQGWVEEHKFADSVAYERFGISVDVNGEQVLIGASSGDGNRGTAQLYRNVNGVWFQDGAVLRAYDGGVGDQFGMSVALSAGDLAVAAHRDLDNGFQSGSAYAFELLCTQ